MDFSHSSGSDYEPVDDFALCCLCGVHEAESNDKDWYCFECRENFELMKNHIRNAPGNRFLELYQDKKNPCILFTYSYWETESDLENYRNSALFDEVWTFTKKLFNRKNF